jgi:hypothetical protein
MEPVGKGADVESNLPLGELTCLKQAGVCRGGGGGWNRTCPKGNREEWSRFFLEGGGRGKVFRKVP